MLQGGRVCWHGGVVARDKWSCSAAAGRQWGEEASYGRAQEKPRAAYGFFSILSPKPVFRDVFKYDIKSLFLSITLMFSFSPKKGTKIWKGCTLRQNQLNVFLSPGFNQVCLSEVSGDKNGFLALRCPVGFLEVAFLDVAWFQFNLWLSGVSGGPIKVDGGIFASW